MCVCVCGGGGGGGGMGVCMCAKEYFPVLTLTQLAGWMIVTAIHVLYIGSLGKGLCMHLMASKTLITAGPTGLVLQPWRFSLPPEYDTH